MMRDCIILLTGCVHPKGMPSTVVVDEDIRKRSYVDALRYYREKTPYYIVFVDNSNVNLSSYFENSEKMEFINFCGNDYDKRLGKGFGEGEIIEYAFKHSVYINSFKNLPIVKISGRHIVVNLKKILTMTNFFIDKKETFISAHINSKAKSVISDIFVAHPYFYSNYLIKYTRQIDESRDYWFEHSLYDAVCLVYKDGGMVLNMPMAINQKGYSGSTGEEFQVPRFIDHLKSFIKSILFRFKFLSP